MRVRARVRVGLAAEVGAAAGRAAAAPQQHELLRLDEVGGGAVVVDAARLDARARVLARAAREQAADELQPGRVAGQRDRLAQQRALHHRRDPRPAPGREQRCERSAVPHEALVGLLPATWLGLGLLG